MHISIRLADLRSAGFRNWLVLTDVDPVESIQATKDGDLSTQSSLSHGGISPAIKDIAITFAVTSSIFPAIIPPLMTAYEISREVGAFGVPYIAQGRHTPFLTSMFCFSIFIFATAASKDIQSILICPLFAGFSATCTLSLSGAISSDMLRSDIFMISMLGFVLTVFTGPLLGPLIGGFTIMDGLAKAIQLRRRTKNWAIHAKHEEIELGFDASVQEYLAIPLKMLALNFITPRMCLLGSFVYACSIPLPLIADPIIFQRINGRNAGVAGLPLIASSILRKLRANNGQLLADWLLLTILLDSVAFFAIVPTLSGLLSGFGLIAAFPPAASAVAARTFLRSVAASGFPLFATYMFESLGVEWSLTLL
ncbi:uncharacterized protein BJX67DRAFT_369358 [Aspergillus lucknowensis]|uniref:Uncharacterized protein n=1 Tax=Aspergillus lucknowensis TaxID=176173 RepID=A0ABR4M5C5_9EURO